MKRDQIWESVQQELSRAKKKHPNWPDHIAAQASIVTEECGELTRACLQLKYERAKNPDDLAIQKQNIHDEAVQVIVTAYRFLENFNL